MVLYDKTLISSKRTLILLLVEWRDYWIPELSIHILYEISLFQYVTSKVLCNMDFEKLLNNTEPLHSTLQLYFNNILKQWITEWLFDFGKFDKEKIFGKITKIYQVYNYSLKISLIFVLEFFAENKNKENYHVLMDYFHNECINPLYY